MYKNGKYKTPKGFRVLLQQYPTRKITELNPYSLFVVILKIIDVIQSCGSNL